MVYAWFVLSLLMLSLCVWFCWPGKGIAFPGQRSDHKGMGDIDPDVESTRLANLMRDLLGNHISKFEEDHYKQALTSCLVALAIEVGRLRWLSVETGEVDADNFDQIFWEATMKHFMENKHKYGSKAH